MTTHSSVLAWSLVGCHLWGCTELEMTEVTQQQQLFSHSKFSLQPVSFRILETTLVEITCNFHLTTSPVKVSSFISLTSLSAFDPENPSLLFRHSEDYISTLFSHLLSFTGWYLLLFLTSKHSPSLFFFFLNFLFHAGVQTINWRRKWQPTPVFLPGESHGQRSLVGYSPWGGKESDTTEHTAHVDNQQCCDGFRCLAEQVSHTYTCIHFPPNSLPIQAAT